MNKKHLAVFLKEIQAARANQSTDKQIVDSIIEAIELQLHYQSPSVPNLLMETTRFFYVFDQP